MISRSTSWRGVPKISLTKVSAIISATARMGMRRERRGRDRPDDRAHHGAHELLEQALLVA